MERHFKLQTDPGVIPELVWSFDLPRNQLLHSRRRLGLLCGLAGVDMPRLPKGAPEIDRRGYRGLDAYLLGALARKGYVRRAGKDAKGYVIHELTAKGRRLVAKYQRKYRP